MSAIDNKQLKAAQAEAATATDTYTHVFKKPFTYEDKTYEQLTLDFGSLTGRDFMAIDREVREREGRVPIVPVYDTSFLMRMNTVMAAFPVRALCGVQTRYRAGCERLRPNPATGTL